MTRSISQSQGVLINQVVSLESQLRDLQERFNVIVNWIESQYYEFFGVPDPVLVAIRGNEGVFSTNTVENTTSSIIERDNQLEVQIENDESTQCITKCDNPITSSIIDETPRLENQKKNPYVRLDKLVLRDLKSLTELNGITNHHAIESYLTNIDSFDKYKNSIFPTCDICNKMFKGRLHLEKHRAKHSRSSSAMSPKWSHLPRKCSNSTAITSESEAFRIDKDDEEVDSTVLPFKYTSDDEDDSCSVDLPFGDIISTNGDTDNDFANYDEILNNIMLEDLSIDSDLPNEFDDVGESAEDELISTLSNAVEQTCKEQHELNCQSVDELINELSAEFLFQSIDINVTDYEQVRNEVKSMYSDSSDEKTKSWVSSEGKTESWVSSEGKTESWVSSKGKTEPFVASEEKSGAWDCYEEISRSSDSSEEISGTSNACEKSSVSSDSNEEKSGSSDSFEGKCKSWDSFERLSEEQAEPSDTFEQNTKSWEPYVSSLEGNLDYLEEKSEQHEIHTKSRPGIESTTQKLCRSKLKADSSMFEEIVASEATESLFCLVCNKEFATAKKVKRHQFQVHLTKEQQRKLLELRKMAKKEKSSKGFPCNVCDTVWKSLGALNLHAKIHLSAEFITHVEGNRRPNYRCLKCNSLFSEKRKLVYHIANNCMSKETPKAETRKNYKNVICEVCGRKFVSKCDLGIHMTLHTGEKNFLCPECGKRFARAQTLHIHQIAVHSKEKKYECRYCDKSFVLKHVRKTHEKKHVGALKVRCEICDFVFADKDILKRHTIAVHENKRPHQCHVCDKSFKTATHRNNHLKTHNILKKPKKELNKNFD